VHCIGPLLKQKMFRIPNIQILNILPSAGIKIHGFIFHLRSAALYKLRFYFEFISVSGKLSIILTVRADDK
jgi:hypothetical protein